MEDLDFVTTKEAVHTVYEVEVARSFFLTHGKPASLQKDGLLFAEKSAGDRMFFLIRGEIALTMGGKALDVIRGGEILGEMSVVTGLPRTATAVARTDCMLISMSNSQFHEALSRQPEFALMLMHMMLARLRLMLSMLRVQRGPAAVAPSSSGCVLHGKLLKDIATTLGESALTRFPKGRHIIVEGATGTAMYALIKGSADISIQGKAMETASPGGVFGEMALIDAGPRAATVTATSDCTLLGINKESFMQLVRSNPLFGVDLLRGFAERLRHLNGLRK